MAMWQAIPPAVAGLASAEGIRALVIRGAGNEAFAAGADIEEFASQRRDAVSAARYEAAHAAALAAIRNCPLPVIAEINGFCLGGGVAIAMACDLRIAGPSAQFALPPAKLGLAYPPDSLRDILSAIPADMAKELIFTGRRIGAEEALRIGLISRLARNTDDAVQELLSVMAENAPLSMRHAKAAINLLSGRSQLLSWDDISTLSDACFDSQDFREGQSAFAEKRKPRFTGR
jgi:enoyl-CoA hydratase/carnithine racemase